MSNEDRYPNFNFDFQRIHEHWKVTLGYYQASEEYLHVVERRLKYWLYECGSWVDFGFAAKHLKEDLGLTDIESRLTWLALKHRVQLANKQHRRLGPRHHQRDAQSILSEVKQSSDGTHDAVWYIDFRNFYMKALERERKELQKLHETGFIPTTEVAAPQKVARGDKPRFTERSGIQWIWANRLLAYLFEALREREAICDDGEMWAALDGVFRDRHGEPITRKDLALWAHQYHNNKASADEAGKPKNHEAVDQIIKEIHG